MSKPWLEQGWRGDFAGDRVGSMPTAKIGLGVFLAVVGCLFALFTSAYFMRMALSDWRPLPVPRLLWLNTGVLVAEQRRAAMRARSRRAGGQMRTRQARPRRRRAHRARLPGRPAPGMAATGRRRLLSGRQSGQRFFYLITGMHGLHLLGGLVALGRTTARAWTRRRGRSGCASASSCAPSTGTSCCSSGSSCSLLLAGWAATSSTFAVSC